MKGRKRRIAVDSQGFLIALFVPRTSIQDRKAFRELLVDIKSKFPTTKIVYVDGDRWRKRLLKNWDLNAESLSVTLIRKALKF